LVSKHFFYEAVSVSVITITTRVRYGLVLSHAKKYQGTNGGIYKSWRLNCVKTSVKRYCT